MQTILSYISFTKGCAVHVHFPTFLVDAIILVTALKQNNINSINYHRKNDQLIYQCRVRQRRKSNLPPPNALLKEG